MLKTILLDSSQGDNGKNFEQIMRIIFLSRYSDFAMLINSKADFDRYLSPGTKLARSPFAGKFGLIVFSTYWLFKHRKELNEVILVTQPTAMGLVGFLAKLFTKVKWVVDAWDVPIRHITYLSNRNKLIEMRIYITRLLAKLAYRKADLFIVGIRPDFQFRYFQVPGSKILLWQTTVWVPEKQIDTLEEFEGGDSNFNILCMKSLHTYECGLDILLQAFLKVQKQVSNARLWIIGEIRADAAETIKEFRNLPGVEYLGFVEHGKLMGLIRQAHLTVIPFRDEVDTAQIYPTKVMEYMTEGKVVIAAAVAAMSEMIKDGEDGLLFRPGDPEDLAEKILRLYKDKDLRQRLADNARKYHSKFDTIQKHAEIFRVFQSLVNDTSAIDVSTIDKKWLS